MWVCMWSARCNRHAMWPEGLDMIMKGSWAHALMDAGKTAKVIAKQISVRPC